MEKQVRIVLGEDGILHQIENGTEFAFCGARLSKYSKIRMYGRSIPVCPICQNEFKTKGE